MADRYRPCDRCGRRARSMHGMAEWNIEVELGVIVGLICDRCQTPMENAEAEVNHATLDYTLIGDRIAGRPKGIA